MNEVVIGALGVLAIAAGTVQARRPKKMVTKTYITKWRTLQQHCGNKENWGTAIVDADALLNLALKKRRYKGKTCGARLMAAQHELTNNDGIWAAHNLAKKILADPQKKLTKTEVKDSLQSFQQALIDLGALRRG
jgi:hypothetical protein